MTLLSHNWALQQNELMAYISPNGKLFCIWQTQEIIKQIHD